MKYPLAIIDKQEKTLSILESKYSCIKQSSIKDKIVEKVKGWKKDIVKKLNLTNPFYDKQNLYKNAKRELLENKTSISHIKNDLINYNALSEIKKVNIDSSFWNKEIDALSKRTSSIKNKKDTKIKIVKKANTDTIQKIEEDEKVCRTLLQKKWEKSLDILYNDWELQEIQKYREKLMKELDEWLKLVQEIDDLLSSLSIDTGVLFDLSKGDISLQDIQQLKKWVEYISQNDGVKELCDMLGRLRLADKTSKEEIVKNISHLTQSIPDINSNEEIVGIRLGKDLEHVLPQELALLSDDNTSILFDLKYIESRLMCFDMEGVSKEIIEIEEEKLIQSSEDENLGPIIICVDTSGSMSGSPETIAKAVTLYMATKAINQNRNCYLINFSTGIETLDLSGILGVSKVMEFLKMSFHGGTDATYAVEHALEMMKSKEYKKADLLMISDFVMGALPTKLKENIKEAKNDKNKFYSLAIGNLFLESYLKDIFDDEWVFNPDNSSIHSIRKISDSMAKI